MTDILHAGIALPRLRPLLFVATAGLLLAASGCSPSDDSSKQTSTAPGKENAAGSGAVVAKVNGIEIREGDLAMAEEDLSGNIPPTMTPEAKRDALVVYVADLVAITQAAENKKIQETDSFKRQLEFIRKKLLMETLMGLEAKSAVSEAAMRKVYDDATKQMPAEPEVRARHILVETEDEAKAIRTELDKGADFAVLAKDKSKDTGAAAAGGDLGYFSKEQMVPEFADVAFKLEKGQLSAPVKSPFGWHIIKVEDKRTRPVPEFEKVRPQLENIVMRKAQAEYLTKLREGMKIERLDKPAQQDGAAQKAPDAPPAPPAEPEKK